MRDDMWCILRTSGGRTIPLVESLVEAGIEAWTPIETRKARVGSGRCEVTRAAPIMPTFAFAPAAALGDLRWWLSLPRNPHPSFSIFRWDGRIPLVAGCEIERLRMIERARCPAEKRITFKAGSPVRTDGSGFMGLVGRVVEDGDGNWTLVSFGGMFDNVRIATFLLRGDELGTSSVLTDTAA